MTGRRKQGMREGTEVRICSLYGSNQLKMSTSIDGNSSNKQAQNSNNINRDPKEMGQNRTTNH